MTTAAEPAWQNIPAKIQTVVRRLIEIARPKEVSCLALTFEGMRMTSMKQKRKRDIARIVPRAELTGGRR